MRLPVDVEGEMDICGEVAMLESNWANRGAEFRHKIFLRLFQIFQRENFHKL